MSLSIKWQNLLTDEELSDRYFGEYNQVSVLGYFKDGSVNRYVIHCDECSKDIDLFGQGNFVTTKRTLLRGGLPCGCSNRVTWSKEQYEVLCRRKAVSLGYVFIGFSDEWKKKNTKITLSCKYHGTWSTNSVGSLLYAGNGCPSCRTEALRATRIKSDEDMIDSFFASGAFHIDTKFWRSERKDSEGKKKFWNMFCPSCLTQAEAMSESLKSGFLPCNCKSNRQQQAYINLIKDGDLVIAVKFGIANNAKNRIRSQITNSVYSVVNHAVYEFPSRLLCLRAERECKQTLVCGVITKLEMRDGYTETTHPSNLNSIIEIYERNGGVFCH